MSKNYRLKWSFRNRKVSKLDAVAFGIPALKSETGFITCPMAGACAAICYARQGSYTWEPVRRAREANLAAIREGVHQFAADAIADLSHIKASIVRIHDSGDFFSQDYLDAWIFIARKFPEKTFYAYTKSLHLDFSFAPKNLKITQSFGGKLDSRIDVARPHSRIFATDKARRSARYIDGNNNDLQAIKGKTRIGLVYHGTRNLTEAQSAYFGG